MSEDEEFVRVRERASDVSQVLCHYDSSLAEVLSFERWFREEGVRLKELSPQERTPAWVFRRLMGE